MQSQKGAHLSSSFSPRVIRKDNVDSPKLFAGIFGYNIKYSLSPVMHNKMSEFSGSHLCYGSFDVPPHGFGDAFNGFKSLRLKGANITQPYKIDVLSHLKYLSGEAEMIGAVNTVNLEDDGFYKGYNTDIAGFIKSVKYEFGIELKNKNTVILGAGGASRAILYSLIKEGAKSVLIINRNMVNAKILFEAAKVWMGALRVNPEILYSDTFPLDVSDKKWFEECDIIINTITPSENSLGFIKSLPLNNLSVSCFAMDISYNPPLTPFLEFVGGHVSTCANGLSMLLFQAIESFYIWTGKRVDIVTLKSMLEGSSFI